MKTFVNSFLPRWLRSKLLYSMVILENFISRSALMLPERSLVLDAGAGECIYKKYFSHCRYIATDMAVGEKNWDYNKLDFISDLSRIPLKKESVEAILCVEVFEHVKYPQQIAREFQRVLKKEGLVILTCPLMSGVHQLPYDFFRYTANGISSIFEDAGFETVLIQPRGGYFLFLNQQLRMFPDDFKNNYQLVGPFKKGCLLCLLVLWFISLPVVSIIFYYLDKLDIKKRTSLGYFCIFKKQ